MNSLKQQTNKPLQTISEIWETALLQKCLPYRN